MIVVHDENTEKLTRMLTDEAINIAYNQAIDHAIGIVNEIFISDAYQAKDISDRLKQLKKQTP